MVDDAIMLDRPTIPLIPDVGNTASKSRQMSMAVDDNHPDTQPVASAGSRYDVIVIGVGGMGSAAAYHLARRGVRVLAIERFDIPNSIGASHGMSRIIRLAYYEHPDYVPLLFRAYELWRELEQTAGASLLHITGSIDAGLPNSRIVSGSLRACTAYGLEHELLTSAELTGRFPAYSLPVDMVGNYQPQGGYLVPEQCVISHVAAAQSMGAEIHGRERVIEWRVRSGRVVVVTDRETYKADRLVITAGPWIADLVSTLRGIVEIERQVVGWFQPRSPELFKAEHFPVFVLEAAAGARTYYGFPLHGIPGFKVGKLGHLGERTHPDDVDREIHLRDEAVLRQCVEEYFPDGNGPVLSMQACMFSNSPDQHFIIGSPEGQKEVAFAGGFSGHGFKFCSVVGEILADLAIEGKTVHSLALFAPERFKTRHQIDTMHQRVVTAKD